MMGRECSACLGYYPTYEMITEFLCEECYSQEDDQDAHVPV